MKFENSVSVRAAAETHKSAAGPPDLEVLTSGLQKVLPDVLESNYLENSQILCFANIMFCWKVILGMLASG